jgi:hypothetical protein
MLALKLYQAHKNAQKGLFKDYKIQDLHEILPHCCKEDLIDFKNMQITYFQFQSRTLKAIGARNGR